VKFEARILLILLVFQFSGCTKDDIPEAATPKMLNFTAIGEGAESIYQYDFVSFSENGSLTDLTKELGLGSDYLTLREVGDMLTFYSFGSGSFSARQWNTKTGSKQTFENFYASNDERAITWGANNEELLFLGNYAPKGSKNLGVRTIDPNDGSEKDLFIENDIVEGYQPLYYKNKLFVTYLNDEAEYHIAVIEPTTNSILTNMNLGGFSPSILIDDQGNFVIVESKDGGGNSYSRYDIETLESIDGGSFELSRSFVPGYLNSEFIDNKLYFQNLYAQPSTLVFGPAIYDFETNTETIIDLVGIVAHFQEENKTSIVPISQGYDPTSGSFLIGYGNIDNINELAGGVLAISEKGNLIGHVELPFVPTYFVKSTL